MKWKIPKEPGLIIQNSWLKYFSHIKIEIADELMLIKMSKLVQ